MIRINNLKVQYDKKVILEALDLRVQGNKITTIIGPNGCGKSTLLKAISRNLPYQEGSIHIEGKELGKYRVKSLAKSLAILPQSPMVPADFSVGELVGYGRYPFVPFGRRMSRRDKDVVDWALEKTDMKHMRCRKVMNLSGGERQRAWIAMALAQEPKVLLLDEPTTYLDIAHQYEVLELIRSIGKKMSMTILMVLHDINQASRYSDEVIMMKEGKSVYQGTSAQVINQKNMEEIFGLKGTFIEHDNNPYFLPLTLDGGGTL